MASDTAATPNNGRVLVVEDDPAMGRLLRRALMNGGYEAVVITDAMGALELLCESDFDLLLTDKNLPGADGLALVRQVRTSRIDVPVVVLTGSPSWESRLQCQELAVGGYLLKPFEVAPLLALCDRLISSCRETRRRQGAA